MNFKKFLLRSLSLLFPNQGIGKEGNLVQNLVFNQILDPETSSG